MYVESGEEALGEIATVIAARLAAWATSRDRMFEPSENTAVFRPQTAIASSAYQDCVVPRPARSRAGPMSSPTPSLC